MKIAVIGLGYVGLSTTATLLKLGHNVLGVDIDKSKVLNLQKGICPINEPGIIDVINENKNNITFSYSNAPIQDYNIVFICVNTPESKTGEADLTALFKVIDEAVIHAKYGDTIVIRSTIPVGTTRKISNMFQQNRPSANISVIFAPEFLRQGSALDDSLNPDRMVFGVQNESQQIMMERIFMGIKAPKLFVSYESAELAKYASNNFLATKISFFNEIGNIASKTNADMEEIQSILSYDKRLGEGYMSPGVGYGGGCLVKDTKALYHQAKDLGIATPVIKGAIDQNSSQKLILLKELKKIYSGKKIKNLAKEKILIVGISFKGVSSDLRNSIALENVNELKGLTKNIYLYDPIVSSEEKKKLKFKNFSSLADGVNEAKIIMVFTERNEINDLPDEAFKDKIVLDGRGVLDFNKAKLCSHYFSVGRNIQK